MATGPCPPTTCPPPSPKPCPQVCPPPPPPPTCRIKPIMKGLHWIQTKKVLAQALLLSAFGGLTVYVTYTKPRMDRYREFYSLTEFDDWEDDMARKGLFQAVPRPSEKKKHK